MMKKFLLFPLFACCFTTLYAQSKYDLNGDGNVNVGDVTSLVNSILGKGGTGVDLNGDGNVNVGDVTRLVNVILGKTPDDSPAGDEAVKAGLCPDNNHPHQIDMGEAGTWACCNLGATTPFEAGGYFAWSEIYEKEEYSLAEYKYYMGDLNGDGYLQEEELSDVGTNISGSQQRDAASAQWGGSWVMPCHNHYDELLDKCTHKFVTINGVNGEKFTAPNGNNIFLPVTDFRNEQGFGYTVRETPDDENGYYWTATFARSRYAYINQVSRYSGYAGLKYHELEYGCAIRPIVETPDEAVKAGLCPDNNHPHQIDMGEAGTWACCNIGTYSPLKSGAYYAWGETQEKDMYSWEEYEHYKGDLNNNLAADYNEMIDIGEDICADPQYDAATDDWGKAWQMPAYKDFEMLAETCKNEWTTIGSTGGRIFTAPTGNKIFLPAAGYRREDELRKSNTQGYYWAATRYETPLLDANIFTIDSEEANYTYDMSRFLGLTVRPVANIPDPAVQAGLCPDSNHPHSIDMGAAGIWACCNVGAKNPTEAGSYYAWGETEEKESYNWSDYKYWDDLNGDHFVANNEIENIGNDISGNSQYDAAIVRWGNPWQMPTANEFITLRDNASLSKVTIGNVSGTQLTAANGHAIFFPETGYLTSKKTLNAETGSFFWLATSSSNEAKYSKYARIEGASYAKWYEGERSRGLPVRPVAE